MKRCGIGKTGTVHRVSADYSHSSEDRGSIWFPTGLGTSTPRLFGTLVYPRGTEVLLNGFFNAFNAHRRLFRMSNASIGLSDRLHEYLLDVSLRESEVMRELWTETMKHPQAEMQIAPEQAQFFRLLIRLMGATRTLEVGVFTGYSALAVAEALPSDGHITACDISEEYTSVAQTYWERAGILGKIDLRIGPAMDTLDALIADGAAGTYDFAFVDADKINYDRYYEQCLTLARSGGLVVLDNTFRDGRVAENQIEEESVQVVHDLNARIHADDRVDVSMLPLADGVTLARKR